MNWFHTRSAILLGSLFAGALCDSLQTCRAAESLGNFTPPSTSEAFSEYVAALAVQNHWLFGKAVSSRDARIIHNADELARDFEPLQPWAGTTSINSELQRYATSFQASNFQFGDDYLAIRALRGGNPLNAIVGSTRSWGTRIHLDGTANALDQLGITSTAGLEVGQLVAVGGRYGLLRICAIDPNTSVALLPVLHTSGRDISANNSWILFLRAWWLESTATTARGATRLSVAAVPAGVQPGMSLFAEDRSGWNLVSGRAMTVTAKTDHSVTLDQPGFAANYEPTVGKGFVVYASISSGELWSKRGYAAPSAQHPVVAMQFELQLPGDAGPSEQQMHTVYSRTALLNLPQTLPWGAWPAIWLYGQDNGDRTRHADGSEIDSEIWWMNSRGPGVWTGFNHGVPYSRLYRDTSLGEWRTSPATPQILTTDSAELALRRPLNAGRMTLQWIWTRDRVYRYLDDQLISVDDFHWTSDFPASIGIDLAVGSFAGFYPGNLLLPWNDVQLQRMSLKIYDIKVWTG